MKKLKEYTKNIAVYTVIASLLQSPFVLTSAHASDNGKIETNEVLNVVSDFTQMFAGFQQEKYQIQAQQIKAQQNQRLLQSLSPNCRNPNGTLCHVSQSQLFPQCPLPPSMATIPRNVCTPQMSTAQGIETMTTYTVIADNWMNTYDQMMNVAANTSYPIGLKCIQDQATKMGDEFTNLVNRLTELQTQLNKEKQAFKQESQKMIDEMAALHDEIGGGGRKKSLDAKTADISKIFSPACQNIIGPTLNQNFRENGLLGLQNKISATSKDAANHNSNRNSIEAEIRNDIQKYVNVIQNAGLSDFLDGKFTDTSKFTSINNATKKQAQEFNIARERIAKELKKLNYEIPPMDKNFSVDFNEFLATSKDFFKKQYINDCVTGADKSGVAISSDQILRSLQQRSTGSQGTATAKYRDALKNILDSDDFIQDKVNKIKALESKYKDITITYQNASAQRVTQTPYDLYIKTINMCEQKYATSNVDNSGNSADVSHRKKVERGQALLRELQQLHTTYASNLSQKALDQVLNCNGETKKAGASCSEEAFNFTSESFCMGHANQCANEVLGCDAEVATHIKTRKDKMENLAKKFNQRSQQMIARANQLYDNQKNAVAALINTVQKQFPGTTFEIPQDMFITMPELKMDSYGVALLNDGKLGFLDELPKKIELLKNVFRDQQKTIAAKAKEHLDTQKAAMGAQRNRWGALMSECSQMIASAEDAINSHNASAMEAQGKMDAQVGAFCNKYADMRENPLAACGTASKLAEDMDNVQARITKGAQFYTRQFRNVCYQYNNESEEKDDLQEKIANCEDYNMGATEEQQKTEKFKMCSRLLAKKESSQYASSSDYGPFKLEDVCDNKDVNDNELAKHLVQNFYDDENDDEDLVEAIKNSGSMDTLVKNVKQSNDSRIADFITKAKRTLPKDQSICAAFYKEPASSSSTTQIADLTKEAENAAKALDDATKALNVTKDKIKAEKDRQLAKLPTGAPPSFELPTNLLEEESKATENQKEKQKALDSANSALALAKQEQPDRTPAAQKDHQIDNLVSILNGPTMSNKERHRVDLKQLGEQAAQSCDAQARTQRMPKMFGSSLNAFDSSILGIQK